MQLINIVLIGFAGTGKTAIGKLAAKHLHKSFIDLDKIIVDVSKADIETIFSFEGEAGFRAREKKTLQSTVLSNDNYVLSVGGGCIIDKSNRELLTSNSFFIVQLVANIDVIVRRIMNSKNKRPIFNNKTVDEIQLIYNSRAKDYNSISDAIIDTSSSGKAIVVHKLIQLYEKFCFSR